MTQNLIITSINGTKNIYLGKKPKNLLKKKKLKRNYIKITRKYRLKLLIKKIKRKLRRGSRRKFLIRRKLKKILFKQRRLAKKRKVTNYLRSFFFVYRPLLKSSLIKKSKKRYKRFLISISRRRMKVASKLKAPVNVKFKGRRRGERPRFVARRLLMKAPFMRKFIFTRLPRLFFFWFIILYSDIYFYLSKIIWNNWFKFLYASFGFNDYSKLFYKTAALYNLNYNTSSFLFDNSLFFNNYNLNNFLNSRFMYTLGSYSYFFVNGIFFYDLKYISISSKLYVNLYIHKNRFTKKNINLKRFFIYKV